MAPYFEYAHVLYCQERVHVVHPGFHARSHFNGQALNKWVLADKLWQLHGSTSLSDDGHGALHNARPDTLS